MLLRSLSSPSFQSRSARGRFCRSSRACVRGSGVVHPGVLGTAEELGDLVEAVLPIHAAGAQRADDGASECLWSARSRSRTELLDVRLRGTRFLERHRPLEPVEEHPLPVDGPTECDGPHRPRGALAPVVSSRRNAGGRFLQDVPGFVVILDLVAGANSGRRSRSDGSPGGGVSCLARLLRFRRTQITWHRPSILPARLIGEARPGIAAERERTGQARNRWELPPALVRSGGWDRDLPKPDGLATASLSPRMCRSGATAEPVGTLSSRAAFPPSTCASPRRRSAERQSPTGFSMSPIWCG